MTLCLALWLQLSSPVAHAEGGGGVKNGGSAIRCWEESDRTLMLEVKEILKSGGQVLEIGDRKSFFDWIRQRIRSANTVLAQQLVERLDQALAEHGQISGWWHTRFEVATIVREDFWSSRLVDWVDQKSGVVHLLNGCEIIPISYLTPTNTKRLLPPQIIDNRVDLLDAFNRNVLELHEALYDIYTQRYDHAVNVLPTRRLIRVLLDLRYNADRVADEIEAFWMSDYLFPDIPGAADPTLRLPVNHPRPLPALRMDHWSDMT